MRIIRVNRFSNKPWRSKGQNEIKKSVNQCLSINVCVYRWTANQMCALQIDVCVSTFMLGGAVRGGEGGHSPRGILEMFNSSCFLERRGQNKEKKGWFLMVMTTKVFQIWSKVTHPHLFMQGTLTVIWLGWYTVFPSFKSVDEGQKSQKSSQVMQAGMCVALHMIEWLLPAIPLVWTTWSHLKLCVTAVDVSFLQNVCFLNLSFLTCLPCVLSWRNYTWARGNEGNNEKFKE